jgi:hypothetical protein
MNVRTGIISGQGLGDTIADLTHLTGIDRLANTYEQVTGKPCGCDVRQEQLNQISWPRLRMVSG